MAIFVAIDGPPGLPQIVPWHRWSHLSSIFVIFILDSCCWFCSASLFYVTDWRGVQMECGTPLICYPEMMSYYIYNYTACAIHQSNPLDQTISSYHIEGNISGRKLWRMTINLPKFDSPIFISTWFFMCEHLAVLVLSLENADPSLLQTS